MFEVMARGGCGRTGRLSGEGWQLDTPGVLQIDTGRFPAPGLPGGTLRSGENGAISLSVGGCVAHILPGYSAQGCEGAMVTGKACVISPGTGMEEIEALRGQIDLFILINSIELYQNAKIFIDALARIREAIGYSAALYLPGLALPNNMALLAYLGVDLVDTARVAYLSGQGTYMTPDGNRPEAEHCTCKACEGGEGLYLHNVLALSSEMMNVRKRISDGSIREFAEYRSKTEPKLVEMLRSLDMRHYSYQERRLPVVSSKFAATTRLSLGRPDIVRFRQRVLERYRKPPTPDVLLLLPCSARKPYSSSKTHGFFARAVQDSRAGPRLHEVIVTSPLGLVPRELELFYPAQHYDIPVTGHWFEDERLMINNLLKEYLKNNNYVHIINHLGDDELLEGIDAESTVLGSPTSDDSLVCLTRALARFSDGKRDWKDRSSEEIASMAAFQFGPPARDIFSGCAMAGRYPQFKVMKSKVQLATVSQANGMLVPTMDGAGLLAEAGIHTVEMENFELTGNLFAVGVSDASRDIRAGDEVAVVRGGVAVASGTARMSGEEMVQSNRGEAVRIRHKAR